MMWTYFVSGGLLALTATPIQDIEGFLLDTNNVPCQYAYKNVTCTSRGLTQVPAFDRYHLNQGSCNDFTIFTIEVNDNHITRVEDDAFAMFQTLNCLILKLSLADNNISYIGDNAFRGIEGNITQLNLSGNRLTTLPEGVGALYKLQELQILDNPLQNVNPNVIAQLGKTLTYFSFDMTSMHHWPTDLHFLRQLVYLYIGNIPFEQLSTSSFHGLTNLRTLTINNSLMRKLSTAFCDLTNLETLNLFHNYNFNLSGQYLFEQCHNGPLHLRILRFHDNGIDFFPSFMTMFQVHYAIEAFHNNMRYMNVNDLGIDNTTAIVSFRSNLFTRIPTGLFHFKILSKLYLQDNKIEYVHDTDLQGLSELQYLNLDSNPIRFITKDAFNDNRMLTTLELSRTFLSQIPESVTTIVALKYLDLSYTFIECTCDMAHLKSWNVTNIHFYLAKCYKTNELIEDFIRVYIDKGLCAS